MTSESTSVDGQPGIGGQTGMAPVWTGPSTSRPLVERIPERLAARLLVAALAAGLAAQLLFVGQLYGINLVLWIALVLLGAYAFRRPGARIDRADLWLPLAALAFAGFPALREDGMLIAFDLAAAGALTLAAGVAIGGRAVTRASGPAVARMAGTAIALFWTGAVYVLPGIRPLAAGLGQRGNATWWRVVRGLLIALPLVLAFGLLFAAADAVFSAHLANLVQIDDLNDILLRGVFAGVAAWLFAGTLTCAWLASVTYDAGSSPALTPALASARLGSVEAIVVLGSVIAIFIGFVAIQAAYLFGGLDTLAVSGMTYSEYARRGFFELIAAAMLAGGLIVVLDRVVARRVAAHRLAAATLAALTGVVLVSAVVRLGLYQQAYGWTELRFYALAAIAWLAAGVVVMVVAGALDRVSVVPRLMVGAGLIVAVGCNLIGPQAFVTEQNLARAIDPTLVAEGGWTGLDADYLGWLGADTVPALVTARDRLPEAERAAVDRLLRERARHFERLPSSVGWPSWSLARERAQAELRAAGY